MSRSRNIAFKYVNRPRRNRNKGAIDFLRGLVLEGLGVAVLVFLYVTVQNSPVDSNAQTHTTQTSEQKGSVHGTTQITGHYASTWAEFEQKENNQISQRRMLGSTVWLPR